MEKSKIKEISFLLVIIILIAIVIRVINNDDNIIDFKTTILAIIGSTLGVVASVLIKKFQNKLRKKPIYISYNINDSEFVNNLRNRLVSEGFNVLKETSLVSPGDEINKRITEAIKDSQIFLLIVSSNLYKSKFLKEEVLIAKHKGIKIIPVLKDDVELPSYLSNYKIADFRGDFDTSINSLISTI